MPVDEKLAGRIRGALADAGTVREVKMFGGLAFMLNGNMVAATSSRGLLVRVGELGVEEALARGAQPMLMNGRKMKGFVLIAGAPDGRAVTSWLRVARAYVETLPPKQTTSAPRARKKKT